MKMQPIDALWLEAKSKLATIKLKDGEFHLVRIDETSVIPSYCGMDESARLFLAFRVTRRPLIPEIKTSAFDSHVSQRPDKSWLYVLRLLDRNLTSVFESLCVDLANEVAVTNSEDDFVNLLKRRVKSWQQLFATTTGGLLTRGQVIGLIGELTLLKDIVLSGHMTLDAAITAWQGPYGSDQDFILADSAIETKTVRDDINEIGISSLEQLNTERFPNLQLVVFGYRNVALGEPRAITLNEIASSVASMCSHSPQILRELHSALLEVGYVFNDAYDQICIAIVRRDVYDVTAGFPHLMPSSIPQGISGAQYQIALQFIAPYKQESYPYGDH
jgi:hypothetical protein